MKRLLIPFLLMMLVFASCKDDPKLGPLSPPIIDPPLFSCATGLSVSGFIPGAQIDIYADGVHIGGGVSDAPWGQSFTVTPELSTGQKITATQTFGGLVSGPSDTVVVIDPRKFYGGKLPKPVVDDPVYNCGGAIGVNNLAKGGLLKVYANGNEVGNVSNCGAGQWLHVTPTFSTGQKVTADEKLCSLVSDKAEERTVQAEPATLPKLIVGDVYEGGKYCVVEGITNGAKVKTFVGASILDESYYSGGSQVVRLDPIPAVGDLVQATQELCATISDPSDPSPVLPCSELPAPTLGPICPGDKKVKIAIGVVGAHVMVYRDGVLAADGGGNEIMLLQPAKSGETYYATQSIGTCTSPPSIPIAVGCDPVNPLVVNIPNGGRAVSIAVDPNNGDNVLVASETGGIFRSKDKGKHWTHVTGSTTFMYTDLTYLPFAPGIVVATAREDTRKISGGGIWRSLDNGTTWKHVKLITPSADCYKWITGFALSLDPIGKRVWAGTSCGLAYSDDAGYSWKFWGTVPGYNNQAPVYSIETPDDKRIVMVTDAGVEVSSDAGATFDTVMTGLPATWTRADHNQVAISPVDHDHIIFTTYYKKDTNFFNRRSVFRSMDFGQKWKEVEKEEIDGPNRPVFVRTSKALSGKANAYDIYWGNGSCDFKRAEAQAGTAGAISKFKGMSFDHCDPADIGFEADSTMPFLLLTDGGLHKTDDKGENWKATGAGPYGYNALQITEVTGQLHKEDGKADLYFGTQDNSLWASPDLGATWPHNVCCEGFYINVVREYLDPAKTKVTGVNCGACRNFMTPPIFDPYGGFSNPPRDTGNPRLLKPDFYIQATITFDTLGTRFDLTKNTGSSWDSCFGYPETAVGFSTIAGPAGNPTVFTPYNTGAVTPDNLPILNIKRITGITGGGSPVVSDITGFGGLGTFATMFAWYKPFGVDPADPNFLIVTDITDSLVKVTTDGGMNWKPDSLLTRLMTANGVYDFRWWVLGQMASVGFDPYCSDHILVGTQQTGVFVTYNRGESWGRIPGTENLPFVSSFFFPSRDKVILSTYGRSLWMFKSTCLKQAKSAKKSMQSTRPFIYQAGTIIPLENLSHPAMLPGLRFYLSLGGKITGYTLDGRTRRLSSVSLDKGAFKAYTWDGKIDKVPFQVTTGPGDGTWSGEEGLAEFLRSHEGLSVRGLIVDASGLKAVILNGSDIDQGMLPREPARRAYLRIANLSSLGRLAPPANILILRGTDFDPGAPIEALIDGKPIKASTQPVWDALGRFTWRLPISLAVGEHSVVVQQRTNNGKIVTAATFIIGLMDSGR